MAFVFEKMMMNQSMDWVFTTKSPYDATDNWAELTGTQLQQLPTRCRKKSVSKMPFVHGVFPKFSRFEACN
jgi:hypothetical protein